MVGIEYTGVDGRTTRFGSDSADNAMKRLRGIKGYNGTLMDSVAANLASAFAKRNNINLQRVSTINRNPTRFSDVPSSSIFAGSNGIVAKIPKVSGMEIRDGKIISTSQPEYVSDSGSVVRVGGKREQTVGEIPSVSDVKSTAEDIASKVANAIITAQEDKKSQYGAVNVITGIKFEANNGPLKITVETTPIRVETAGDSSSTTQQIGEEVMVHESMSVERHSLVYVISRKNNVSPSEAKVLR